MFETKNPSELIKEIYEASLMECTNFIFIWYFNRNLLAVFYKTHLTFCLSFSSSTYYTSESVNMADIKNYSNPEEVHNKYYNSQKMMLGEKNILIWRSVI